MYFSNSFKNCAGLHHRDLVPPAFGAVPLALGLRGELHAVKVEPLDGAQVVVAADHVAVGYLVAQAVRRLVGVDVEVAGVDLVPVRVVFVVTPPRRVGLGRRFPLARDARLLGASISASTCAAASRPVGAKKESDTVMQEK